jgi:hypothetical protein|tara:strand:+ start:745 stop:1059 length:315 start_codon:yes stop_codon:yes gene_type:complete
MALASTVVANSNTTIITGTSGKVRAVTCLFFCNTNTLNTDTITVYAVPGGGSAGDDNTIIRSAEINATDTLTFDTEKLLLDPTDSLIGIAGTGTISATASYTDV